MIKFGIHTLKQLSPPGILEKIDQETNISITLYDKVGGLPDGDRIAARILLRFADDRGAYKRTYSRRFEAFDRQVVRVLLENRPPEALASPWLIHDTGVSDARTSCDFFRSITESHPGVEFHASDYDPEVFVIESNRINITVNASGQLLEIVWPPFVFNIIRSRGFLKHARYYLYPLNHLIRLCLEWFPVRKMLKAYEAGSVQAKRMLLFCPEAVRLSQSDPRFHLTKHNLLDPSPFEKKLGVLRAMNVLNPSYFTEREMGAILGNIFEALDEGGCFITGSNQDSESIVHGAVYQKRNQGFNLLMQSGDGPAIHERIVSIRP